MARLPNFASPGQYVEFIGQKIEFPTMQSEGSTRRFLRLGVRESPLKYHFRFANLAAGARSSLQTFNDLEMEPKHICQAFLGISYGGRLRLSQPVDQRLLKWDKSVEDVNEIDTGNIEHEDSPIEDPRFELWIAPTENYVPAVDVENVMTHVRPARSIDIHLRFVGALFQYDMIDQAKEPEIYDKLVTRKIPSRPITFGGAA